MNAQPLKALLTRYRESAKSEREKGDYFELLSRNYLSHDSVMQSQYSKVWLYADWAKEQGINGRDTGIDLVAKLRDEDGYCAIQCKFYDAKHKIAKRDIDSFFTASGKPPFTRRIIIDTTEVEWSEHAEDALDGQSIPATRITIRDMAESNIDWSKYASENKVALQPKKSLFPHQEEALKNVQAGLAEADRGKLIMACGTGKTFTSLKIAEKLAGEGKRVLYLVPSLALMAQTVREWTNDTETPLHSFAVCSDVQVGKRKAKDDMSDLNVHDLAFPATTNAQALSQKIQQHDDSSKMTVVFSTYQSIQVISDAQNKHDMPAFDLIICDEAHRTTGATLADEGDSNFVKVHHENYIQGSKRIYMTATPRIYSDAVQTKANEVDATLCSMDDEDLFGKELHKINFSEAVSRGLLTDYKVIVLAVDEETVSAGVQKRLADENSEVALDDAAKIIGCYRALTKHDLRGDLIADPAPMQRAVAFCKDIKSSKRIAREFMDVVDEYLEHQSLEGEIQPLECFTSHVDGTFNAKEREKEIDWLNNVESSEHCHILSNARCLSEGVDVPSLDAILFMHPRKSVIDVVQSVGRVMRRAEGKQLGYVILPVGVPAGMTAEQALNDNEKYKVVWQILNALRSHDERLDSDINRISLGEESSKIGIVAIADSLPAAKQEGTDASNIGSGGGDADNGDNDLTRPDKPANTQINFEFDEFSSAILAKIVKKCGTREYWEDWANDIAKIAERHISRINGIIKDPASKERKAFDAFLEEIRDDLNDSITEGDAVEMLAQHLITQPVFEALFDGYSFTKNNPVSLAIQKLLDVLNEHNLAKESESLEKFYASVKRKVEDTNTTQARQKIIVQLYDKFFKNAFPKLTEKLGIVYTPVEVVDFIIHSVNDVLKAEFGESLGSKGVHIIDPFTGTGTFITRLLQSGLIAPEELQYKYENEIHANEIVLLAYYIAAINIEQVYHEAVGEKGYTPFGGICLTDTFQLYEKDDLVSKLLVDNSQRRIRQKELDLRVIIGNPPYSAGQESANDNAANVEYPCLDETIKNTYAKHSVATSTKNLMDSYIRAIRWGSDQLGESGVMAYVSGSAWIERSFADGMRKCLAEEFTNIYVFNLRGDVRKNMLSKGRAKEGGNIFDSGSMTGIAITLFVKNPDAKSHGNIYHHNIGDDLGGKEKRAIIENFASISGITKVDGWEAITPDKHHDWLSQRDESFDAFIEMGSKRDKHAMALFENYSLGINTNRDPWCYNASKVLLESNMKRHIDFYNHEVGRYRKSDKSKEPQDFVDNDTSKIKWSSSLYPKLKSGVEGVFNDKALTVSVYRPYSKSWLYYDSLFNHRTGQFPKIFPHSKAENKVIAVSGTGARAGFSAFMTNAIPCLDMVEKGQAFPLYLYEATGTDDSDDMFASEEVQYARRDGMSDEGLAHFNAAYPKETLTKEDVFYYIYGLLHCPEYRTRYADNLSKQLPRIPCVKKAEDFWAFSKAGRELAELHINYEEVEPYAIDYNADLPPEKYYVKKMKFAGKRPNLDKSTIIYNSHITLSGVPLEAYDYIVNGKAAIDWVMERQCVKTDKKSGIVNDANLYATETMGDAAYPLKLLLRVITVSLETQKIVRGLPKLDIDG